MFRKIALSSLFLVFINCSQAAYLSPTLISLDIPFFSHHQQSGSTNNHNPTVIHNDQFDPNEEVESDGVVTHSADADSCQKCVCGVVNRKMRIVGGVAAEQNEFPWMVALSRKGKFYCAASIITKQHLLTAAHCVEGFQPKDIKATIGDHNRSIKNDTRRQVLKIKEIIKHDGFQISNFKHDIAILKVENEIHFGNPHIQPACLPSNDDRDYTGLNATISGWGRTGESKPTSNEMRKVDVPIISIEECRNTGYIPSRITDNMMCAGFSAGQKDSCQGDSGGPLQIAGAKPGTMEVIGIVSWGRGCARPNFPGVYTRVARYLDWIESNIHEECICRG